MIYHFNTSGYCFTEEMLIFLSKYKTFFTLSIDGGEALTNYIRPVQNNLTQTGYFKKIKEIAPTLLYYFPDVEAKVIINNRYVDLTYQTYLDLEAIGFRYITLILDFNSRPQVKGTKKEIQRVWEDKDTEVLQEQLTLISKEILLGFIYNKKRAEITNFNKILKFLLLNINDYSPDRLQCQVFSGRTLETLTNSKERHCFEGHFKNLEDAKQNLINEFNKTNGQCPLDKDCPVFLYCANFNCPISSHSATKMFFGSDTLDCILTKSIYPLVLNILNFMNINYPDSFLYIQYINSIKGQKGE